MILQDDNKQSNILDDISLAETRFSWFEKEE